MYDDDHLFHFIFSLMDTAFSIILIDDDNKVYSKIFLECILLFFLLL